MEPPTDAASQQRPTVPGIEPSHAEKAVLYEYRNTLQLGFELQRSAHAYRGKVHNAMTNM